MTSGFVFVIFLGLVSFASAAPPVFDEATSYRYVYYAYAAYDTPAPGTWNCRYCTNYTKGFIVTKDCQDLFYGSFAYVGHHPDYKEIVASFRGSDDIANWIEDLDAIKTVPGVAFPGIPEAQVDKGFYNYYESLKSCVLGEIKTLTNQFPLYQVSITGHSLGAAGSALCAMDLLVNNGYKDVRCLNFGEPRVGNKAYSDAAMQYMPGLQRMTDYGDCVPNLPYQAMGYHHEAYEIFEHPKGGNSYKVCDASGEDPTCNDGTPKDCSDHLYYMGVHLVV